MKRFLFVLLAAALVLPMMAQITPALRNRGPEKVVDRTLDTRVLKSVKAFDGTVSMPSRDDAEFVWDFETDDDMLGWVSFDADGDGYGWEIDDYNYYSGLQCVTSRSYYSGSVLYPDNWLISPLVPLGGELKLWAQNYLSSYPDKFMVYVIPADEFSVDAAVPVTEFITPPTAWTEYTVDLSAFAGMGYFAIRHYDCVDQFRVLIDYITLTAPAAAKPENVTADPAATTAEVVWEDAENVAWNLRYRETVETETLEWDFEDGIEGWTLVDADNDGNNWTYFNMTGVTTGRMTPHTGEGLVASASYDNDVQVALTPDNWLISPKVKLDGKLSLWAAGQDASYAAEVFGVFVSTDMENWTQIGEDVTATGTYTQYTFDLSSRAGEEGYFAIRHYNVTDQFWLNIDDVTLTTGLPNEWIVIEGVTSPYTIDGLNPETTYEVQVQGVNDEGVFSGWTSSVLFTTLADDPIVPPVDQVGAPTFQGYTVDGIHGYGVYILPTTEGSEIMYRVFVWDEENGEWTLITDWSLYEGTEGEIYMTEVYAKYRVEAYAFIGEVQSMEVAYEFVVQPFTGIDEMNAGKTVAGVRYFNMAGQEMQQADGLTIVVTTYTDGTTSAAKVVK